MKFVVDAMLGKVALWLRLTGNDTIYSTYLEDDDAIQIAMNEDRILLTSDEALYSRACERGLDSMLVRGTVDDEVASVFHRYAIQAEVNPSTARCSKCNGELEELTGNEIERVKHLVFENTFNHYDIFWLCKDCDSVYFQGGYWENIENYMNRISEMIRGLEEH
ncbi:MAG: Mut7-C RNAse domain-containing protein [Candidatus Thorarchaeota archaeon]